MIKGADHSKQISLVNKVENTVLVEVCVRTQFGGVTTRVAMKPL